ncbi:MAG: hypothetical protein EPN97_13755 [Alphaproteobacteria bacterium]|nr:MAG: hypothetical protein EPN97_13755 [Alphaproteobacteria bacterium]
MASPETDALEKSFNRLTLDSDTAVLLMDVEEALRGKGQTKLADRLDKLQQDITGYYAGADKPNATGPGEQTQKFIDGYEPLTPARVNGVLNDIAKFLVNDPFGPAFKALAAEAQVEVAAPAVKTAVKPGMRMG